MLKLKKSGLIGLKENIINRIINYSKKLCWTDNDRNTYKNNNNSNYDRIYIENFNDTFNEFKYEYARRMKNCHDNNNFISSKPLVDIKSVYKTFKKFNDEPQLKIIKNTDLDQDIYDFLCKYNSIYL